MVLFGTGRILNAADATDDDPHFVYGLWDGAPTLNTRWLEQTVTEVTSNGQRLRTVSAHQPDWASGGDRGWRLALPAAERVVGEGQFLNSDRFYFTATDPTVPAAQDGQADGANWLMQVNYLTGGSPAGPIFDIDGNDKIDAGDNVSGAVIAGKYLGEGVSSQAVLTDLTSFSRTFFNRQSDVDYSPPKASADLGVSGGHFDVDFYAMAGTSTQFKNFKHIHEYDDLYNVTGVNFLNASAATLNLGTKLSSTVPFKVLAMNQYLNPASQVSVGGSAFVSVKTYGGLATAATAKAALDGLSSYTLGDVKTLAWKLPLDGFKSKDWWGDGGPARAGLIPTQTGCVNKVTTAGVTPTLGPNGERHNGAFTLQIIRATTPDSALELNYAGGGAKYGWRVKASEFTKYVVAEYTTFWHHPNGKCYGAAGWVPNAPEVFTLSGKTATAAHLSTDPKDGSFGVPPTGVTVTATATTTVDNTTTIVVTYSDNKKATTVITTDSDGMEQVVMTDRDGTVTTGTRMSAGSLGRAPEENLQPSRRINWREMVRP